MFSNDFFATGWRIAFNKGCNQCFWNIIPWTRCVPPIISSTMTNNIRKPPLIENKEIIIWRYMQFYKNIEWLKCIWMIFNFFTIFYFLCTFKWVREELCLSSACTLSTYSAWLLRNPLSNRIRVKGIGDLDSEGGHELIGK